MKDSLISTLEIKHLLLFFYSTFTITVPIRPLYNHF
nr:MAG TPA: hypothetical protein [Caudoviricetes sp.]